MPKLNPRVKECVTAKDYVKVCDDPGLSCMSQRAYDNGYGIHKVFEKAGWWPSLYYFHNPQTTCIYLHDGKDEVVQARAILIHDQEGKVVAFNGLYGVSYLLTHSLMLHMYTKYPHIKRMRHGDTFEQKPFFIPRYVFNFASIGMTGVGPLPMCPIPYFDNWDRETRINFDGKQFRIGSKAPGAKKVDDQYWAGGWMVAIGNSQYKGIDALFGLGGNHGQSPSG